MNYTKRCTVCGETFQANSPLRCYCSPVCTRIGTNQRKREQYKPKSTSDRVCPVCGTHFVAITHSTRYCSGHYARVKEYELKAANRMLHRQTRKPKPVVWESCRIADSAGISYGHIVGEQAIVDGEPCVPVVLRNQDMTQPDWYPVGCVETLEND